jgi:hypothetical protein
MDNRLHVNARAIINLFFVASVVSRKPGNKQVQMISRNNRDFWMANHMSSAIAISPSNVL